MKIGIVLYDGFDELDAIGPYEVLLNAAAGGADVLVDLVTREPAELVTGGHGLSVRPQGVLDGTHDLVIVPGGGWAERAGAGAFGEIERGELPGELRRLREEGTTMASVCTGAMVLSAAGVTRGRSVSTHHAAREALAAEGAEVLEARVVDDGDLLTAGGVTAGIDLALWLVEREWGAGLADAVAHGMEYERAAPVQTSGA